MASGGESLQVLYVLKYLEVNIHISHLFSTASRLT